MLNVGGGEFLVILLVALIVLGPQKLPEAARQVGHFARELRKMSNAFQSEMRDAMEDPIAAAARDRGPKVVASEESAAPEPGGAEPRDEAVEAEQATPDVGQGETGDDDAATADADNEGAAAPVSGAEAAGMYDITPSAAAVRDDTVDDDDDDDEDDDDGDGADASVAISTAEAAGMYDVDPAMVDDEDDDDEDEEDDEDEAPAGRVGGSA